MKEKLYIVCDSADKKAIEIKGCPNIGVEYLGRCTGRLLKEDGTVIGAHYSSTIDFLRLDLKSKVSNPDDYEFVDLIGQPIPEKFKKKIEVEG